MPGQHDDADVGLEAERRAREQQRADDADGGERHREHDDERVPERLVLGRHDRVDEDERQDQRQQQLVERLGLLLDLGAEPDGEVARDGHPGQPRLHGRDGLAQRHFDLGAHARDALLVPPLDLDRALLRPDVEQVLGLEHLALTGAEHHLVDVLDAARGPPRAGGRRSGTRSRVRGTGRRSCRRRSCAACWPRRSGAGRAAPPSGGPRGRPVRAGLPRGRSARP